MILMPKGLFEKLKEGSSKKHSVGKKNKEAKKIKEKVPMDDAILNRIKETDKEHKKSGLMSLEEFQNETHKTWSKRENVKQVDHALNKYNQFVDNIDRFVGDGANRWEKAFLSMKSMLELLVLACNDYKKRGGTRNVDKLLSQAVEEEKVIDEILSEYYNSKEIFKEEKSESVEQGHDIYFELYCLKNTVKNHLDIKFCEKLFSKLKKYQEEKETKGIKEKVSGSEFDKEYFLKNKDQQNRKRHLFVSYYSLFVSSFSLSCNEENISSPSLTSFPSSLMKQCSLSPSKIETPSFFIT